MKAFTTFGPSGATVEDVRLLRGVCARRARIKVWSRIKTLAQVMEMIEDGAYRIGISQARRIIKDTPLKPIDSNHKLIYRV